MTPSATGAASLLLSEDTTWSSAEFGLDKRLMKAVAKLGFVRPTLVQSKMIPLALKGKDIMVRARTGSGKTLAYALPAVHRALRAVETGDAAATGADAGAMVVVLVPSKELVQQVAAQMTALLYYCSDLVSIAALGDESVSVQKMYLRAGPDIIVATPGRLVVHAKAGNVKLGSSVQTLVVDEADLVLSYGYADDVRMLVGKMPPLCQTMLMSATLSPELDALRQVALHKPAILKLEEGQTDGKLAQFFVEAPNNDRELLLYALLKLNLISGKIIFFVNSVDACYALKLLLEQFAVKSAVLNAELPANSRRHILGQFNRGVFDYLIATDEALGEDSDDEDSDSDDDDSDAADSEDGEADAAAAADDADAFMDDDDDSSDDGGEDGKTLDGEEAEAEAEAVGPLAAHVKKNTSKVKKATSSSGGRRKRAGKKTKRDAEYGVARGVDFRGVTTVVNYDFPTNSRSYTHRIGRTARGGASGTALSIVASGMDEIAAAQQRVLANVVASQPEVEGRAQPQKLPLDVREIEGLRYRVEDVRRAVTAAAVKEARLAELKQELLNSTRLQEHFESNPHEAGLLQHDRHLRPTRVQPHMGHVPDYLMPAALKGAGSKKQKQQRRKKKGRKGGRDAAAAAKKAADPLQSFALTTEMLDAAAMAKTRGRNSTGAGAGSGVMSVRDMGQSTSGRRAWKAKHGKGRYGIAGKKKRRRMR